MSWGNPQSSQEKLLCGLMSPLSLGYGIGSYFRLAAYSQGYVKRVRLPIPVVSIGNITCGGTGKTPMAIDVTRRLIAAGYKVAVLSRGYARKSKQKVTVVSNGKGEFAMCEEAGDEPLLIALSVPEAIVIVGSSRVETAALAIEEYQADAIVLDDGFQHIRLERDLDVILIDYNDDPENDTLLPAGRLREPLTALNRAKVVVITKVPPNPDEERLESLRTQIRKYAERAEIVAARFVPKRLRTSTGEAPLTQLKGQRVVAFCGVARPEGFAATLDLRSRRWPEAIAGAGLIADFPTGEPQVLNSEKQSLILGAIGSIGKFHQLRIDPLDRNEKEIGRVVLRKALLGAALDIAELEAPAHANPTIPP